MKIVEEITYKLNEKKGGVLAQVRAKHYPRWCEVCGVTDPADIDYSNPFVKIEWLLCDPGWLHAIKTPKGVEEFLNRLDDPLAKWIYLNYKDEETGDSYRDLEKNRFASELKKSLSRKQRCIKH